MKKKKIIVLLSGGMDSTTLLYWILSQGHEVEALSFDYGQKHKIELQYAKATAAKLGVHHKVMQIDQLFAQFNSNSALLSDTVVPEGHYADITMRSTVVPNRNAILLMLATGYAISKKFDGVAYASHTGDHAVYRDCTPEFFTPLKQAVENCDWHKVTLYAPFINLSKSEIAYIGNSLNIDWENETYSCYNGKEMQCGKCGTCTERLEAIEEAKAIKGVYLDLI